MPVRQAVERLATAVGRPVVDLLGGHGCEPLAESGHPEHTEPGIAGTRSARPGLVALGSTRPAG
jgi:hypothetical protein